MREVGILKKDPETLKDQIDKLEVMSKSFSDSHNQDRVIIFFTKIIARDR